MIGILGCLKNVLPHSFPVYVFIPASEVFSPGLDQRQLFYLLFLSVPMIMLPRAIGGTRA